MKDTTFRILVASDVIQRVKSSKFIPTTGQLIQDDTRHDICDYVGSEHYGNGKALQKAVAMSTQCEVCVNGAMFLSYIERFDGVNAKEMLAVGFMGVYDTKFARQFGTRLMAQCEYIFERVNAGEGSVPSFHWHPEWDNITKAAMTQLREKLETDEANDEYGRGDKVIIGLMERLIENDGEGLF